jgi:ketosteroid isomerase-like protein
MSEENVEIVRRVLAEYEQGNFRILDPFDPNVRVRWLDTVGAEPENVGTQEAGEFLKGWFEVQKDLSLTAERLIDAGDQVVAIAVWRGIGKGSGAVTEWRQAQVWTLRDGKVTSIVGYKDSADALEAAGLSE